MNTLSGEEKDRGKKQSKNKGVKKRESFGEPRREASQRREKIEVD